jgi:hypothetical protein
MSFGIAHSARGALRRRRDIHDDQLAMTYSAGARFGARTSASDERLTSRGGRRDNRLPEWISDDSLHFVLINCRSIQLLTADELSVSERAKLSIHGTHVRLPADVWSPDWSSF